MGRQISLVEYKNSLESTEQLLGLKVYSIPDEEWYFINYINGDLIWLGNIIGDKETKGHYINIKWLTIDPTNLI